MAVNGHHNEQQRFIDTVDVDDPEYIRELQRPADVAEDLKAMQQRERVTQVLNTNEFRSELEDIVQEALSLGSESAVSMAVLQQISELIAPSTQRQNGFNSLPLTTSNRHQAMNAGSAVMSSNFAGTSAARPVIIPIDDITKTAEQTYIKGERQMRCKLAALYRLLARTNYWSSSSSEASVSNNHITLRLAQEVEHFLINPVGLSFSEISASSLLKVDMQGKIVSNAGDNVTSTSLVSNHPQGYFKLYAAIHSFRPDIKCVLHCQSNTAATAVSAMKCGLLPISRQSLEIIGNISYYDDYFTAGGSDVNDDDDKLVRALGVHNKIMLLRNHGFVACGETIEEAFYLTQLLVKACDIQVCALSAGGVDEVVQVKSGSGESGTPRRRHKSAEKALQFNVGELEFEASMRMLDNLGYRTGYACKAPMYNPPATNQPSRHRDVEHPPFAASPALPLEYATDEQRLHMLRELIHRRKEAARLRWISTPNNYSKAEISETKTPHHPAKNIKWVRDYGVGADGENRGDSGTPIKISSRQQFSSAGAGPREIRSKRDEMQARRMQGTISSGPETKRVNWDEADALADAVKRGERVVTVSAVSKGIIEREQQHNAGSYTQPWARNPFVNVTDNELNAYKREIIDAEQQQQNNSTRPAVSGGGGGHQPVLVRDTGSYHASRDIPREHAQHVITSRDNQYVVDGVKTGGGRGGTASTVLVNDGVAGDYSAAKKKKGLFSFGSGRDKKDKDNNNEVTSPTTSPR